MTSNVAQDGQPGAEVLFDPTNPVFIDDPYPVFATLRDKAPVQWHDELGVYVTFSHAGADAVLRDRGLGRIWRDREPAEVFASFNLLHQTSILESEPPTHTRLRRLVAGAFGRGHVERMRPWIAQLADSKVADLVTRLRDGEPHVDLIANVAEPLPVDVIAELLDVPHADRNLLRPWSNAIVKMYEYGLDAARQREAEQAATEFVAYLRELVEQRRNSLNRQDGDPRDLITDLVAASDDADGSRLSVDEVVGTSVLLLMAGHEATVNVVGNGMFALLSERAQWQRVVANPGLVLPATEEMLRYDSALQLFERTATRDVEVCGVQIPEGAKIAALLGAANRDPAVFENPDALDVSRTPNPHLSFGAGIHFCLGAPLARIEIQAVMDAVRRQAPELVVAQRPSRRQEFVIRGWHELQVGLE